MSSNTNNNNFVNSTGTAKRLPEETLLVRIPTGKATMDNGGVGFIDNVMVQGESKKVIHYDPGRSFRGVPGDDTVMMFQSGVGELNKELTADMVIGDRNPHFVAYNGNAPVGSGWVHEGRRGRFIVVKINRMTNSTDPKLTLFPSLPRREASAEQQAVNLFLSKAEKMAGRIPTTVSPPTEEPVAPAAPDTTPVELSAPEERIKAKKLKATKAKAKEV